MATTPPPVSKIMIIDGEPRRRAALTAGIRRLGLTPRIVRSLSAAEMLVGEEHFAAALVACGADGVHGLPALHRLLRVDPVLRLIVVDSRPSPATAFHCLKHGAWGYLAYPGHRGALRGMLVADRAEAWCESPAWKELSVTSSATMRSRLAEARQAANSEVPVLIRGETGTGKDLLASAIHELSPRRKGPLVAITCANLAPDLLMSELFGHVRGAFTDAHSDFSGKVVQAEGGTLVLKEVGDIPLAVQSRLLRFVQDHRFERLGDPQTHLADVRLIATSTRDLLQLVRQGRLREDLYYRLSVVEVELPALRHRPQDIMPLAQSMLDRLTSAGGPPRSLAADCPAKLIAHPWPGNVRQLANEVQRAAVLSAKPELMASDFSERLTEVVEERPWVGGSFTLQQVADEHIRRIIETSATISHSAAILGIRLSTLWHWRQRVRLRDQASPLPQPG